MGLIRRPLARPWEIVSGRADGHEDLEHGRPEAIALADPVKLFPAYAAILRG
jgi:hypothetical protein